MKKLLLLSILFTSCQAGLADYEYVIKDEAFREDVLKMITKTLFSFSGSKYYAVFNFNIGFNYCSWMIIIFPWFL